MRLIDADTLNDYVMDIWGGGNIDNTVIWYGDVFEAIHNAPTIDAVPVVRCKDCIFFEIDEENADIDNWYHLCGDTGFGVMKMDFCSHGERREAE